VLVVVAVAAVVAIQLFLIIHEVDLLNSIPDPTLIAQPITQVVCLNQVRQDQTEPVDQILLTLILVVDIMMIPAKDITHLQSHNRTIPNTI